MLRVSSKIDELTQALGKNGQINQISNISNNNRTLARSSSGERGHSRGAGNFQQHLFNQIFKNRLIRAFTEEGLFSHPFEHFVINAPEEVHRITSKVLET